MFKVKWANKGCKLVKSVLVPTKSSVKLDISWLTVKSLLKKCKNVGVVGWKLLAGSCGLGVADWELWAESCQPGVAVWDLKKTSQSL